MNHSFDLKLSNKLLRLFGFALQMKNTKMNSAGSIVFYWQPHCGILFLRKK